MQPTKKRSGLSIKSSPETRSQSSKIGLIFGLETDEGKKYIELQEKWVEENQLQIGDTVLCTSKGEDYQGGWNNTWVAKMDKAVGQTGTVVDINDEGIRTHFDGCELLDDEDAWYPFFVLTKVDE